ncbi:metallo-beta-lactamase superfamily protein [Aspergillus steynii IBT 23096]|uniref:Metallo-beta-lactamase superfamily protein n=1 Tax=Aspergillus steynii IBT 23096 TaxID=1392250 RepID=A0A2I2GMU0_9EURO|nr:metallo-beta-lactamase superfamily protein [Aspergillus steynii IBT 23096]PLB54193.1 metallo-beta-lactamase superfamily protein [Aspergillus steynii IBT 23096]
MDPTVHSCYEPTTGTWQYIVACPSTKEAAIIDPVLDFDPVSLTISTASADSLLDLVAQQGYTVRYLLETHAHADHLTASFYLQQKILASGQPRPSIGIGQRIRLVQDTFAPKYNVPAEDLDAAFDRLLADGERFSVGDVVVAVLALPGHTPDHVGYRIGANVFTGDSIFNPDVGSARCDFPGGDARTLYRSMQTLLSLPPEYRLYTGHDYPPTADGDQKRDPLPYVTVAEQRERNRHAKDGSTEDAFVRWRSERDQGLREPRLMHQAMQVNIRGGRMAKDAPLRFPVGV